VKFCFPVCIPWPGPKPDDLSSIGPPRPYPLISFFFRFRREFPSNLQHPRLRECLFPPILFAMSRVISQTVRGKRPDGSFFFSGSRARTLSPRFLPLLPELVRRSSPFPYWKKGRFFGLPAGARFQEINSLISVVLPYSFPSRNTSVETRTCPSCES